MPRPDELSHYGVLGMKWGVRKDRTSAQIARSKAKTSKKIARLEKKAKYHTKKAKESTDTAQTTAMRGAVLGGVTVFNYHMFGNLKKEKMKDILLSVAYVSTVANKNQTKEHLFKAEAAKRKAAKIKARSLESVDGKKSKLTFDSAVNKLKVAAKDKHNHQVAIRATKNMAVFAYTVYSNRELLRLAGRYANVKYITPLAKERIAKREAYARAVKLPSESNNTKYSRIKQDPKYAYYINPDGSVTKAGKVKFK